MGELIVLKCENCGAMLEFTEKRDVYFCEHCGYKHVYEKINLGFLNETYASCPLCKRNDKVKKISACSDIYQPKKPIEYSEKFVPPNRIRSYFIFLPNFILGVIMAKSYLDARDWFPENIFYLTLAVINFIASLIFFINVLNHNNFAIKNNQEAKERWEIELRDNNKQQEIFPKELEIWDKLYYCERDDIVYQIDSNEYIPKENVRDYIEEKAINGLNI